MIEKFVYRSIPPLTILLALAGLLVTSCFHNTQGFSTRGGNPILEVRDYIDNGYSNKLSYQLCIMPDDEAIKELASQIDGVEDAYEVAVGWIYVSEQRLNGTADKWLSPHEFLIDTPHYRSNPVPGEVVGDCEEQAHTLVSLIRAEGVPPEEVRVVLGKAGSGNEEKGHAWVELLTNGYWLVLDPSCGPCWDNEAERLVNRPGVPFEYYAVHTYPVPVITAYYNDIYYLDPGDSSGNAPGWWLDVVPEENHQLAQKESGQVVGSGDNTPVFIIGLKEGWQR